MLNWPADFCGYLSFLWYVYIERYIGLYHVNGSCGNYTHTRWIQIQGPMFIKNFIGYSLKLVPGPLPYFPDYAPYSYTGVWIRKHS